jgi:hypothetical protein
MSDLAPRLKQIAESGTLAEIRKVIEETDEEQRSETLTKMYRVRKNPAIEAFIHWADRNCKLPKGILGVMAKEIANEPADPELAGLLAKIIMRQIATDDDALSAACSLFCSSYAELMFSKFLQQDGEQARNILIERRPEIICYFFHRRSGTVFDDALNMLRSVARAHPPQVVCDSISDILEDCVHSEQWIQLADGVLSIAKDVNPVSRPKGTVRIDTSYMINWCLHNEYLKSTRMSIRNLIGELCFSAGCAKMPTLKCLHKLMELNRTVDLLMFLDQGHKRYRGHDIHQFNVAALGLFFLNTQIREDGSKETHASENSSLKSYLANEYKDQLGSPEDIERTWLLTSLLHDHAIPMGHMFGIAPMIRRIIENEDVDGSYKNALESLKGTLRKTYRRLFSDDLVILYYSYFELADKNMMDHLEKLECREMSKIGVPLELVRRDLLDHGFLAAVNMTSKFENEPLDIKVKNSARAIALHNQKELPIKFSEDPLAFLLVLCDELQEWGREVAIFPQILIDISSLTIQGFDIDHGKRHFTNNMRFYFRSPRKSIDRPPRAAEFKKAIFDGQKKSFFQQRLVFDKPEIFPMIRPARTKIMI